MKLNKVDLNKVKLGCSLRRLMRNNKTYNMNNLLDLNAKLTKGLTSSVAASWTRIFYLKQVIMEKYERN